MELEAHNLFTTTSLTTTLTMTSSSPLLPPLFLELEIPLFHTRTSMMLILSMITLSLKSNHGKRSNTKEDKKSKESFLQHIQSSMLRSFNHHPLSKDTLSTFLKLLLPNPGLSTFLKHLLLSLG